MCSVVSSLLHKVRCEIVHQKHKDNFGGYIKNMLSQKTKLKGLGKFFAVQATHVLSGWHNVASFNIEKSIIRYSFEIYIYIYIRY